jgi:hypothetical protein
VSARRPPAEALALAGRLDAPQALLAALAAHPSPEVRRALACNPSAPTEHLLGALLLEWPDEVLANPTLDLLLLGQPDLLSSLPDAQRRAEAASPRCPWGWAESVLQGARGAEAVRVALLKNGALPLGLRHRGYGAQPPYWRAHASDGLGAALGPAFWSLVTARDFEPPSPGAEALAQLAATGALGRWLAVKQAGCALELLEEAARSPDMGVRAGVARHPRATPALLLQLAVDPDEQVRRRVAMHPALPVALAVELVTDPSDEVAAALVRPTLQALAPQVALAVATRGPLAARHDLAGRKDLPREVLEILALDEDALVRQRIAGQPHLPDELVQVLASDGSASVRAAVAWSAAARGEVLQQLRRDPVAEVRAAAGAR